MCYFIIRIRVGSRGAVRVRNPGNGSGTSLERSVSATRTRAVYIAFPSWSIRIWIRVMRETIAIVHGLAVAAGAGECYVVPSDSRVGDSDDGLAVTIGIGGRGIGWTSNSRRIYALILNRYGKGTTPSVQIRSGTNVGGSYREEVARRRSGSHCSTITRRSYIKGDVFSALSALRGIGDGINIFRAIQSAGPAVAAAGFCCAGINITVIIARVRFVRGGSGLGPLVNRLAIPYVTINVKDERKGSTGIQGQARAAARDVADFTWIRSRACEAGWD